MLLLAGCAQAGSPSAEGQLLAEHGLSGLDARAVIERLESQTLNERPGDLRASVGTDVLKLSDQDGNETSLPMPETEFYLSLAPYAEETHECFNHSLTTCKGELRNEDITVRVVADGESRPLVDQNARTGDNGFAGIWLPRDLAGTIEVEHDGLSASGKVSTGSQDPTCVTTLKLA
ncbi:CueP family metal-binding protein [Kineosporia babensis]